MPDTKNTETSPDANSFSARIERLATQASEIKNVVAGQGGAIGSGASQIAGKFASSVEIAKNFIGKSELKELETNYVTVETETDRIRRKNLYYVSSFIGFVWMLFHFTVVYFFGIQLGSAILVGAFLGFGNLVSLLLDIPVGILQRYFYAKRLYLFSGMAMLGASLIFLKFIYASSIVDIQSGNGLAEHLTEFLDSGMNLLLLAAAAILYGFAKEVNDITTLSYILNNADPSEYSSIISRNNIFVGAGMLFGLVASGFVLALNPTVSVFILISFVVLLIAFMLTYFDNSERTFDFSAITKLKVIGKIRNVDQMKEYAIGYLSKADFAAAAKTAKFLFLKPMPAKVKFNLAEIIESTKKEAVLIRRVLVEMPLHFGMLWAAAVVLGFGFWDTFATSFLVEHLVNLSSPQLAYLMLAAVAIPAFVTQSFFIGISKKIGILPVVSFGLILSSVSLMAMAFFPFVVPFLVL